MSYQEKQMPVAVVTGSSTGIGLETSLILAMNGYRTYATMRNLDKSSGITSKASKEDGRAQMETNFFSTVRVIKAVVPIMRKQHGSTIVNITSICGRVAIPF